MLKIVNNMGKETKSNYEGLIKGNVLRNWDYYNEADSVIKV